VVKSARKSRIKVLVADDQTLFRQMLVQHLDHEPDIEVVGEAQSGTDTLSKIETLTPDVVLLDIQLGDMDGLEVTEHVRARFSNTRIVLLTGFHNEAYIYRGLQAGASGYLSKDSSIDGVLDAVRRAFRGDALLDPAATTRILRKFEQHGRAEVTLSPSKSTEAQPARVKLTPREHEILMFIADGLSNQEIASRLVISEYTVKTHVSNLFRKIEVNDRVQAILYALKHRLR